MSIKPWGSLERILRVKTLQCQDYANTNGLASRVPLSLWHYNCLPLLESDLQSSIMRFDSAAVALQRRPWMILLWKTFHLWIFPHLGIFPHLWISFIGGSPSFIKRYPVIHPFLRWILNIKRASLLNFNSSFFFLQRWRMFNRPKMNCGSFWKKRNYCFFRKKRNC